MRSELKNHLSRSKVTGSLDQNKFRQHADQFVDAVYGQMAIPPEVLAAVIGKYDPNFAAARENMGDRDARRALSQRARDAVRDYEVGRQELLATVPMHVKRVRPAQLLLDGGTSEQAREHNEKWIKLLQSEDKQNTANEIYQYIMDTVKPTFEQSISISTEQFVADYPRIRRALETVIDMKVIRQNYPFTPEQDQNLEKMERMINTATAMLYRVDVCASPYYAELPLEKVNITVEDSITLEGEISELANTYDGAMPEVDGASVRSGPVQAAHDIQCHASHRIEELSERLGYRMEQAGGDPRVIYSMDGVRLQGDALGQALSRGEAVLAGDGQGMKPLRADLLTDPPSMKPANEMVAKKMAEDTLRMFDQIKAADPWWMTTGSRQFNHMEKAVQEFVKLTNGAVFPPALDSGQQMSALTKAMRARAQEYQAYKLGQRGSLEGKNAREAARLQAADALLKMCDKMDFLLQCGSDSAGMEKKLLEGIEKQDARIREQELLRQQQLEQQAAKTKAKRAAELAPEADRSTTPQAELEAKGKQYASIPNPGPKYENDGLIKIWKLAINSGDTLTKLALANKPLEGTVGSMTRKGIADLVTYYTVAAERAQLNNSEPFKPGPIEQFLIKDGKSTLQNNEEFWKMVGPLTPKRLDAFLMNDEAKRLGLQFINQLTNPEKTTSENSISKEKTSEISLENSGKPNPMVPQMNSMG